MVYNSTVTVEMLSGMADIIDMVDKPILDTLEQQVKEANNLNKVDQKVGEVKQRVEILEESCYHYQEFILADMEQRRQVHWEQELLWNRTDQAFALIQELHGEMQLMGEVIGAQTCTINTQNGYLKAMKRRNAELGRRLDDWGWMLGNPIVIEDDDDRHPDPSRCSSSHNTAGQD